MQQYPKDRELPASDSVFFACNINGVSFQKGDKISFSRGNEPAQTGYFQSFNMVTRASFPEVTRYNITVSTSKDAPPIPIWLTTNQLTLHLINFQPKLQAIAAIKESFFTKAQANNQENYVEPNLATIIGSFLPEQEVKEKEEHTSEQSTCNQLRELY